MNALVRTKFLPSLLMVIFALSVSGCIGSGDSDSAKEDSDDNLTSGAAVGGGATTIPSFTPAPPVSLPSTPEPNLIAQAVVNVGVLSFEQINETYAVLTGMDPNRNEIRNLYEDLKTSLPINNDIKSFSATTQNAASKLAARYCFEAIRQDRETINGSGLRGRTFVAPGFNFGRTPAQLNDAERSLLVKAMLDNFWQRDPGEAPTQDDTEFQNLFLTLVNGEANNNTTTRNAAVGVCTAILSNANVLFM